MKVVADLFLTIFILTLGAIPLKIQVNIANYEKDNKNILTYLKKMEKIEEKKQQLFEKAKNELSNTQKSGSEKGFGLIANKFSSLSDFPEIVNKIGKEFVDFINKSEYDNLDNKAKEEIDNKFRKEFKVIIDNFISNTLSK